MSTIISIAEKNKSRKFSENTFETVYLMLGRDAASGQLVDFDSNEAVDELLAGTPTTWQNIDGGILLRRQPTIDDVCIGVYEAALKYTSASIGVALPRPSGSVQYQFDVSTESANIRTSYGTSSFVSSGTAPTHANAINVGPDGEIAGADVLFPVSTFSLTYKAPAAFLTSSYLNAVEAVVGYVNSATFKGRAAGTVLFTGCRGSVSVDTDIDSDITYSFSYKNNVSSTTLAGISGVSWLGWNYVWVEYEIKDDTAAKQISKQAKAVHVETVYRTADLATVLALP